MDETSETELIMDFDAGVDSIEFLIDSFGYDGLDLIQEAEDADLGQSGSTVRLVDVNAAGLDASNFKFFSRTDSPAKVPSD